MKRAAALGMVIVCVGLALPVEGASIGGDEPKLVLVNPGEGELRELRYVPEAGDSRKVTMTTATSMSQRSGGQESPMTAFPTSELVVEVRVNEVMPDGLFKTTSEIMGVEVTEGSDVAPQMVAQMRGMMEGAVGMTGWAIISDRGLVKESDWQGAGGLDPQMAVMLEGFQRSLSQTTIPLPEEAVGVGATWEWMVTMNVSGVNVAQTTRYKVVSFEGDVVTLDFSIEQSAIDKSFSPPDMPGTTVDINRWASEGEGRAVLSLREPAPRELTLHSDTDAEMTLKSQGMEQAFSQTVKVEMTLAGVESGDN